MQARRIGAGLFLRLCFVTRRRRGPGVTQTLNRNAWISQKDFTEPEFSATITLYYTRNAACGLVRSLSQCRVKIALPEAKQFFGPVFILY